MVRSSIPLTKSKKPLFDNAKMAAELTRILLSPYDAQHLPIKTIKFIKKDTAIQFEIEVPKDNDVSVNGKIVKASEIAKEEVKEQDKEKEKEQEQDTQKNKGKEAEKPKERSPRRRPWPSPTTWPRASSPSSRIIRSRPSGRAGPRSRPTRRRSSSPAARTCS